MNILDPQGPIAAADKTILIDSVAIMLATITSCRIGICSIAAAGPAAKSNDRAVIQILTC